MSQKEKKQKERCDLLVPATAAGTKERCDLLVPTELFLCVYAQESLWKRSACTCVCVCERERERASDNTSSLEGCSGGGSNRCPGRQKLVKEKWILAAILPPWLKGCWKRSVEAAYLLCVRERDVEGRESGRRGLGRREKLMMTRGGRGRKRPRASAGSMCVCEGAKRLLERYLEWSLEHGSQLRAAVTPTFDCLCYFGREAPFQSQVHRLH